jgi:predicted dehydrogenase
MAETRLGVGIIGYGYIGRMHACAHVNLPFYYSSEGFHTELIGVCTTRLETALDAVMQAGFEYSTTDPDEILSHPDISLVHICSPNDTHRDFAITALNNGKHVYCEKPLARNLAEARAMLEAAEASRRVHQVAFQYRFVPAILRAKQMVEEEVLGTPISFRVVYLHAGYTDPNRPMSWRLNLQRSGGGALHDLGSHAVDLLRYLLGDVKRLCASLPTFVKQRPASADSSHRVPVEVDDLALMQIEMENGAFGTLEASRVATGATDELCIEIHGTRGALRFNLMEPNWLDVYDGRADAAPIGGWRGYTRIQTIQNYPEPAIFPSPKASVGWTRVHIASLYDFVSNCAKGRVGSPSFVDGVAVQAVLEAAQVSHASGAWVDVGSL